MIVSIMLEIQAKNMKRGTKFKLKSKTRCKNDDSRHSGIARKKRRPVINLVVTNLTVIFICNLIILLTPCRLFWANLLFISAEDVQDAAGRQEPKEATFERIMSFTNGESNLGNVRSNFNSTFSDEILLDAESRAISDILYRLSPIKTSSSQLRKLLTKPGVILSSIMPQTLIKQLVLERPNKFWSSSLSNQRVKQMSPQASHGLNEASKTSQIVRVPQSTITGPFSRPLFPHSIAFNLPSSNGPSHRAGLLSMRQSPNYHNLNIESNRLPVVAGNRILLMQRPQTGPIEAEPTSQPADMFDDNEQQEVADANRDDGTERDLDHIDQLIKDEFENRLTLNEHIVRNNHLFRVPSIDHDSNATQVATKEPEDTQTPDSNNLAPETSTLAMGDKDGSAITTMAPIWSSNQQVHSTMPTEEAEKSADLIPIVIIDETQNSDNSNRDDSESNHSIHSNYPRSIEAGFRPIKLENIKSAAAAAEETRMRNFYGRRAKEALSQNDERKSVLSLVGSFVPTDPETIAQLKQNNGLENDRSRFSRDNNNQSSLFRPANRARLANSANSRGQIMVLVQQQRQQQPSHSKHLESSGDSRDSSAVGNFGNFMEPSSNKATIDQSTSWLQKPSKVVEDLAKQPIKLSQLNPVASNNIQRPAATTLGRNDFGQQQQQQQQHSISLLSETLKRLHETKERIKQLQAEINATNPSLFLTAEPPLVALTANNLRPLAAGATNLDKNQQQATGGQVHIGPPLDNTTTNQTSRSVALIGGIPVARVRQGMPPNVYHQHHKVPQIGPAQLMASAFGRAAQSAIATRQAGDQSSWLAAGGSSGSLSSSNGPTKQATTSEPIILSSTMSVSSSDHSTTANPFDLIDSAQLARPDLSQSSNRLLLLNNNKTNNNNSNKFDDYRRATLIQANSPTTITTNHHHHHVQNGIIGGGGGGPATNQSSSFGWQDADNRMDTNTLAKPTSDGELDSDANRHFQFRYQETRPTTTQSNTSDSKLQQATNKRVDVQANESFRPASVGNNSNQNSFRLVEKFDTNDLSSKQTQTVIDVRSERKPSEQFNSTTAGQVETTTANSIGQSVSKFFKHLIQSVAKLFGYSSELPADVRVGAASAAAAPINRPPKLTTERVLYALITFTCSMAIVCALAVMAALRCQSRKATKRIEMGQIGDDELRIDHQSLAAAGPRLDWRKLVMSEETADRFKREKLILDGTMRNVSLLARQHELGGVERRQTDQVNKNRKNKKNKQQPVCNNLPAPLFKQTCCHCVACSESWLFRDEPAGGNSSSQAHCSSGFYHPAPRGKLPFGAASSVNKLLEPTDANQPFELAMNMKKATPMPIGGGHRNPIGGTRLRMMSAIDETSQPPPSPSQDHENCLCERRQSFRAQIVTCSCLNDEQHNSDQQQQQRRRHCLPEVHQSSLSDANVGPEEQPEGEGAAAAAAARGVCDLCNCCHDERDANLSERTRSDDFNEVVASPAAEAKIEAASRVEQADSCRLQQCERRTNYNSGGQVDSIRIIRSKATSAKSAANCESNASGGDNNSRGVASKKSCSSKLRAKLSATGGKLRAGFGQARRLEQRRESNTADATYDQDADDYGAGGANSIGAKGSKGISVAPPPPQQLQLQLPLALPLRLNSSSALNLCKRLDCDHEQRREANLNGFTRAATVLSADDDDDDDDDDDNDDDDDVDDDGDDGHLEQGGGGEPAATAAAAASRSAGCRLHEAHSSDGSGNRLLSSPLSLAATIKQRLKHKLMGQKRQRHHQQQQQQTRPKAAAAG